MLKYKNTCIFKFQNLTLIFVIFILLVYLFMHVLSLFKNKTLVLLVQNFMFLLSLVVLSSSIIILR